MTAAGDSLNVSVLNSDFPDTEGAFSSHHSCPNPRRQGGVDESTVRT